MFRHTPFELGTRIDLLEDEKRVSGLDVFDLQMRIGDVPVRCGGIGNVWTAREQRMKGYSRRVLEEAVHLMAEQGYHLSALFGIPNYYDKFGFASALIECEASVVTRDAEGASARYPVRAARPEDLPAIARIYELHAQRSGAVVRCPEAWPGFRFGPGWSERFGAFVVTEGERVIGYATHDLDPTRCRIGEAGYATPAAYSTLLARAAQLAVERRVERITLHLPPDDPFLHYCRRYGCKVEITYPHRAQGMARIVDQTALLERLQPLFQRRLQATGMGDRAGALLISTDLGKDCLGQGPQTVSVELPQWLLAQLLLGYRSAPDALFETGARADDGALPMLEALFPAGYPYIWNGDRF
jgi:predicted acetyltransferase